MNQKETMPVVTQVIAELAERLAVDKEVVADVEALEGYLKAKVANEEMLPSQALEAYCERLGAPFEAIVACAQEEVDYDPVFSAEEEIDANYSGEDISSLTEYVNLWWQHNAPMGN